MSFLNFLFFSCVIYLCQFTNATPLSFNPFTSPKLRSIAGRSILQKTNDGVPLKPISPWNRLLLRQTPTFGDTPLQIHLLNNTDNNSSHSDKTKVFGGQPPVPWVRSHFVSIILQYADNRYGQCTGSILNANLILSAAHCFYPSQSNPLKAVYVFHSNMTGGDESMYFVKSVAIHKYFNPATIVHDIALVLLNGEIPSSCYNPVYLSTDPSASLAFPGPFFAAGYGADENGIVGTLNEVDLVVQDPMICLNKTDAPPETLANYPNLVCATAPTFPTVGGKDTCNGDSGGPLYIKLTDPSDLIVQLGITSFGGQTECALPDSVTWYTNVAVYILQIQEYVSYNYVNWNFVIDNGAVVCG